MKRWDLRWIKLDAQLGLEPLMSPEQLCATCNPRITCVSWRLAKNADPGAMGSDTFVGEDIEARGWGSVCLMILAPEDQDEPNIGGCAERRLRWGRNQGWEKPADSSKVMQPCRASSALSVHLTLRTRARGWSTHLSSHLLSQYSGSFICSLCSLEKSSLVDCLLVYIISNNFIEV